MVKVFTLDENGKISFTKEELEKLLEEVEKEAFDRGRMSTTNQLLLPYYNCKAKDTVVDKSHWENQNWWKDPTCGGDITTGTPITGNKTVVTC